MAGTLAGGKAAAVTNKHKYGKDWYAKIVAIGGHNGHTGGFFANRDLARSAGAKGGRISRRTGVKSKTWYGKPRVDEGATFVYDRKRGLVPDIKS